MPYAYDGGQGCDLYSDSWDYYIGVILELQNRSQKKRQTPHQSCAFLNSFFSPGSYKM